MACEPNTLAEDAKCMCFSVEQHMQVQTYALAVIAGVTTDPDLLAVAGRCFCGVPMDTLMAIKTHLLCQILSEENGDTPVPPLPAGPGAEDWDLFLTESLVGALTAEDDGGGFTHYCYRFSVNGGGFISGDGPVPVGQSTEGVQDLGEPGDDIEAQVRYCTADGTPASEWSASKFLTPCEGNVSVSNLDGEANRGAEPTGYAATFTWDPHPNPLIVALLNLQRADAPEGPYVTINFYSGDAETGEDQGPLTPQTLYYYRVQTTFNNGCDPVNGDPFELDSGCFAEVPTTDVINVGVNNATVTWEPGGLAMLDPIQEWVLNWGTTPGGPYPNGVGDIEPSDHEHEITGLDPETTYYFRVRAVDTETCFATSAEGTFTTEPE